MARGLGQKMAFLHAHVKEAELAHSLLLLRDGLNRAPLGPLARHFARLQRCHRAQHAANAFRRDLKGTYVTSVVGIVNGRNAVGGLCGAAGEGGRRRLLLLLRLLLLIVVAGRGCGCGRRRCCCCGSVEACIRPVCGKGAGRRCVGRQRHCRQCSDGRRGAEGRQPADDLNAVGG